MLAELARVNTRHTFCSLDRLEVIIGLEISDLKAILRIRRDSIKIDLELMAHEVCEGDGCGHVKPIFCNKQVMLNFVKLF